jgi:DNA-binding response OmpR family regulator
LAGIIHIPKKYKEKSDSYLKSLGSLQGRKIYLIDGSLYIGDRCVEAMLGKEEKRVLELIINRKNEVVDVDMIADLLWGEGETKSFWAITKLMQRIRKKVEEWSGGKIKLIPLRGRGYFLEE